MFTTLTRLGAGGLAISGDPFFNTRAALLGALSLKHALPTMYQAREFTAAGGLISYVNPGVLTSPVPPDLC